MSANLDSPAKPRARTASTASTHATKRRRAARACLACRTRKVRCDVSWSGPPCMNCSLDDIACVVKARKPKSNPRQGNQPPHSQDPTGDDSPEADDYSDSELFGRPTVSSAPDAPKSSTVTAEPPAPVTAGARQDALPDDSNVLDFAYEEDAESPPPDSAALMYGAEVSERPGQPRSEQAKAFPHSQTASLLPDDWFTSCAPESGLTCPPPEISTRHHSSLHPNSVVYNYYPFLTLDNLYNCMPQDVDFMESEGCFHLPTRAILDQIVRQYFLHIHPLLPLLNEGDFWEMYYNKPNEGEEPPKLSLLVFQAIMFASCNFVNWSMESAKAFGYESVRSLRAAFYRRAKLLYDFGAESSPVAIAQAALLLSYWTPPVREEMKPNTVWLSIAIQNAKNAEAPYYATLPTTNPTTSCSRNNGKRAKAKRQNLLKRLWWCCVIRDRILPLGLRRGIQITRTHFDFEQHPPLGLMDLEDEINRSLVYTPSVKRDLVQVLSDVLHLCVILTDVLLLVFPLDGALDQARGRITLMPLEEAEIRRNKRALMMWYKTAASAPVSTNGGAEIDWNKHESVVLYTHLMYMYYHSARMALYHYELQHYLALMATTAAMDARKIRDTREAIQNTFSNITDNFRGLNQRHLTRWLPISMVAFVAFPLALHVLNIHLSASVARQIPREGTLIEVMKSLQVQYDGVDWVAKMIRQLIELVQEDATSAVGRTVTNWSELLTLKPKTYLTMSLALDMGMSSGRFPDRETLKARLNVSETNQISEKAQRSLKASSAEGRIGNFLGPLSQNHDTVTMGDLSFGHLVPSQDNSRYPAADFSAEHQLETHDRVQESGVQEGSPPQGASSAVTADTTTLPEFNAATSDEFSSLQGSVDMNDLFDVTLADFGLEGEFSVAADMEESQASPQMVDRPQSSGQILAGI